MKGVDREPYEFEHPGLEFYVTKAGSRLGVRIGVPGPKRGELLYVGGPATEPFPLGWEVIARDWLSRNEAKVKR